MDGTSLLAERDEWAAAQFGAAELGDTRRTRRSVAFAARAAGDSSGSIPAQSGSWADAKAVCRLFAVPGVTHAAVCQPHFEWTREVAGKFPMVFLVQDIMVAKFTSHRACKGLGPIGTDGTGLTGLHQMNVLAADPLRRLPLGLMYQRHYARPEEPRRMTPYATRRRSIPLEQRESHWWVEAIAAIGSPPPGVRWVHVGDRGEDIFGAYHQARQQGADWLIRVSQNRSVVPPEGPGRLVEYIRGLPGRLHKTIVTRRAKSEVPETVTLHIAAGEVTLTPPSNEPQQKQFKPISCWLVRVWEDSPPSGHEALEWMLCTSLPGQSDDMPGRAAGGYGCRWMIEEFHTCEKTGCQTEQRRLESRDRLEPRIGMLSVLAVRRLALKFVARDDPETPARHLFDDWMIDVMANYLKCPAATMTVNLF